MTLKKLFDNANFSKFSKFINGRLRIIPKAPDVSKVKLKALNIFSLTKLNFF